MTLVREAELPGLGKKYQLNLENGEQLVVIIHDDGRREIYYFAEDADEPYASVTLSDMEFRQLGSIIGGSLYQPKSLERLESAVSDLLIEWLKVKAESYISGKSIEELKLRKDHGINIIAVMEDKGKGRLETFVVSPGPDYVFKPGHTIIAAGNKYKIKRFQKMFGEDT